MDQGSSSDEHFAGLFSITKKSLVDDMASEKGPFTKTATKVIAGQEAVRVTATDSTLYVSTKDARPLETEPVNGSTSSGKVSLHRLRRRAGANPATCRADDR